MAATEGGLVILLICRVERPEAEPELCGANIITLTGVKFKIAKSRPSSWSPPGRSISARKSS